MSASSVERIPAPMGPPRARGRTLPQMALIAIGVGVLVVILRMLTTGFEHRIGVYGSGIVTAVMFVGVGLYSVRKRNLWFSLRMLYMARRIFPASLFGKVVFIDRLETWRATHVVVAMLALLPFWWHMQRHLMGPLEAALASAVALLYTSGLIGVLIQDRLPHYMTKFSEHEVRTQERQLEDQCGLRRSRGKRSRPLRRLHQGLSRTGQTGTARRSLVMGPVHGDYRAARPRR